MESTAPPLEQLEVVRAAFRMQLEALQTTVDAQLEELRRTIVAKQVAWEWQRQTVLKAVGSLHNQQAAASKPPVGFPVGGTEAASKGQGKGKAADKGRRQSQREKERAITSIMSAENAAAGEDASIFRIPSLNETMSALFELPSDDLTDDSGTPKKAARPKKASQSRTSLRPTAASLPAGWMQSTDPKSGRPYYYDANGNTQWLKPEAPAQVPMEQSQPQTATDVSAELQPSEPSAVASTTVAPTTVEIPAADPAAAAIGGDEAEKPAVGAGDEAEKPAVGAGDEAEKPAVGAETADALDEADALAQGT